MTKIILTLICISLASFTVAAAEYEGENIDGESYSCTGFSYDTAKYYYGDCEFDGDEITFTFSNGRSKTLTLDDEEIDDPSSISAFDYGKAVFWDFDVDID